MIDHGFAKQQQLDAIRKEVDEEVNKAAAFALNSPKPALDEIGRYVYASGGKL